MSEVIFVIMSYFIYLYNWLGEDISDDIQQVWGLPTLNIEGLDDEFCDLVQITSGHLQRQQHQNREPVEEVMHCGPGESPGYSVKV